MVSKLFKVVRLLFSFLDVGLFLTFSERKGNAGDNGDVLPGGGQALICLEGNQGWLHHFIFFI